jgi:hypothetical protein
MPQPDSSRSTHDRYNESNGTWPLDPAAPRRFASHLAGRPGQRPKHEPDKDGRTPQDPDGNEEQERQAEQVPSSRRASGERGPLSTRSRSAAESDTGSWVPQPFTLDDELEDTWPTVPTPYLDD